MQVGKLSWNISKILLFTKLYFETYWLKLLIALKKWNNIWKSGSEDNYNASDNIWHIHHNTNDEFM